VQRSPASHQAIAVERLVFVESRAIQHAGQHFINVCRHLQIGPERPPAGLRRRSAALRPRNWAPVQPCANSGWRQSADRALARRVRRSPDSRKGPETRGVHVGAAELFVGRLLARRHLHQRRPTQKDVRPVFDEHGVIATSPGCKLHRPSSCPKTSAIVGIPAAECSVSSRKTAPPGTTISACRGKSAPPLSTKNTSGKRFWARDGPATAGFW